MTESEKDAEKLFHEARKIASAAERQDFLNHSCIESPELRNHVEALLQASGLKQLPYSPSTEPDGDDGDSLATDHGIPDETIAPSQQFMPDDSCSFSETLPRLFGDFELLEEIAQGGMGVVYKARQISLNRTVAIKMILSGQFAGKDEVKRFYMEAESAAGLDHPGIVPVFDVGCVDGQHYFAMAFVQGASLAARINDGFLPPRQAATFAKKIALAADLAHRHGVVHRDLKPGNVLLDKTGEPKITDFGLAKRVESCDELTATGMVMGTPGYMPPEQASGRIDQINASADIYSIGAILYALVTGRPPFEAASQFETLMQVINEEPVPPRHIEASIPKDLEAICLKCLEKDPLNRYGTSLELADDLGRFLAGEPIHAKNDWIRRVRKWSTREPVLAAHLLAILAMMLLVVTNYWIFGSREAVNFKLLWVNEAILAGWAVAAILLQKIYNIVGREYIIPYVWAAMNPLFLTIALGANAAPRGTLLSLYLLLMVTTCFFRRVGLVAVSTIASLVGYLVLLGLFPENEFPNSPGSYRVVFAGTLVVTGILLGFLTLRINRLGRTDLPTD